MELVVVERRYDPPVSDEGLEQLKQRAGPCFEMRRITLVQSYVARDRRRSFCVYRAPDAAAVRDAHDQEGFAYEKVWSAFVPAGLQAL